jgi:class 3 adenylate cyclase/tetratricopeptide (TPR) repeat protein
LNEGGEKFCGGCGVLTSPNTATPQPSPTPASYTPKHLAEQILTSKSALEGERKQVTVLFADLKGSMELLADRDPEEARKILDPVLELMMEAIHRYEGTVNQVMGDGIMALFGAPLAHEDHAVRACYAALRMQDAVKQYGKDVRRHHGIEVQIRVGLNSGEVVVRSIGSDLHMDYTAVGQTTHLAARMEQLATPGSIRLTADTLRLAEGYLEVKPLGPVPVRGLVAPVEVYEATRVSTVRSRLQAATARGLTRFVGRNTEVEQLRKALEQARVGHGQVVATVGEPGVGKSRLFHEFTHSHRTQGWLILESGSVSYGKATTYLPIIALLKGYFNVSDRETHREIREKVTGKLMTLDRTLEPTLPALMALLGVPLADAEWQALDPPQRRRRTLEAVKRLVLRESQVQPLLVVFEDLHWIDSETQAFLESLVESLPTARLLLLVNYRPEYQHGWGSKTYYTQLRVDALAPESANELLLALLGSDATVEPLKPILIARTGGNPLFLEESVRTLVETHALSGERGAHRLVHRLDTLDMPATVQAILASRIDRLAPDDKQLLQTASVLGKDVPFAPLSAMAELAEEDLRRALTRLQSAEFLYETRLFPELEYTFKHALTHEVTYGTLLHERRRALHAGIVDTMESLYADRLAEHVERLAHHASRGERWQKAVQYSREAGLKSLACSANREATAYFEQALSMLPRLPDGLATRELAVDLRLDLYSSLQPLDELPRLLDYLRQAETLARALRDEKRIGQSLLHICHLLILIGDCGEGVEVGKAAHEIGVSIADTALQVMALLWLGCGYFALGDHPRMERFLRQGLVLMDATPDRGARLISKLPTRTHIVSRSYLSMFLAELGRFAEARPLADEALAMAEDSKLPYSLILALWQGGAAFSSQGDFSRATAWFTRGVGLAETWGYARASDLCRCELGYARALAGQAAEGLELVQSAVQQIDASSSFTWLRARRLSQLGEANLLAGELDAASECAAKAHDLSRRRRERGFEVWALRLQAEIALAARPSNASTAEERYREAMTLAGALGMRPLVAHCHFGLGTLYRRTGSEGQAIEHLNTATTMYREMEMRSWLEKAQADLGK